MKLQNRCVVITGAGSGIGRACAVKCAEEGANVVVADINEEGAAETVKQIQAAGGNAIACTADVADPVSVASLVQTTLQQYGKANALINSAAIQINKTVEDTSLEEWNTQMSINVGGIFLCSKLFLPHLKTTKGSIVSLSSVNAYFVEPSCAGYCATKAAIIGLTKAMAIDHGHEGVRVNCICPGYIDTGLAEGYFQSQPDPARARAEAGKLHALWRIGKAEEVAKVAVFLASDDASFVTGSAYVVDGGFGSGLPPK
ncbi:SDR family oxidoreductase [Ilyomonas limi]|uniref:SDR family oxidoreductase n=1 Tax=Ilyomonas limi TaxID=2575867 RepID=A0A4U3KS12_9BACT|nr:SDR family oxidoreductase [Ilyomonas limi]TKK65138.1 SDR family oxidoreductase [Ilyomonas limi]